MKIIKGDILSDIDPSKITVVLHGCNCFHTMGAGIAAYLSRKYPLIREIDRSTPLGETSKLGTCSAAPVEKNLLILNLYTQFRYGTGRQVNYEAVYRCLEEVSEKIEETPVDLRSPMIGCGLAGGDWNIVGPMFEKLLPQATIYYL